MNRFGLGPTDVGRLIGYDHASAINSNKIVRNMLVTKNVDFTDEIIRWAEVFDDILPNGSYSIIIIEERVTQVLDSLTEDRKVMIDVLNSLLNKIQQEMS